MIRKIFKPLLMLFATLLWSSPEGLLAQEIPEDSLIVDFANCMTGCRDFEGELGCEILCGCTMERFKANLTYDAYLALNKEMEEGMVSPENRTFLDDTAQICVAEMDRVYEEMGLIQPVDPSILPPPEYEGDEEEGEG